MAALAPSASVPGKLQPLGGALSVGLSLPRAEGAGEEASHAWAGTPDGGSSFQVRKGPDYASNKEKAASLESLYECVAADFFHTAQKRAHVAGGEAAARLPSGGGEEEERVLGMPANFVVTMNMPNYAPPNPVWGKAKDDGDGYVMVLYFVLTDKSRRLLIAARAAGDGGAGGAAAAAAAAAADNGEEAAGVPPSLGLLRRFIYAREDDPVRGRFKGIARVANLPEVPLNGLAKKLVNSYNATPFLIRTTSTFHRGANYFEVGVDVHRFSYLALVGLNGIKDKISSVVADLAFVVQAEEDDEMPEQILGCARLCKLQLEQSPEYPE